MDEAGSQPRTIERRYSFFNGVNTRWVADPKLGWLPRNVNEAGVHLFLYHFFTTSKLLFRHILHQTAVKQNLRYNGGRADTIAGDSIRFPSLDDACVIGRIDTSTPTVNTTIVRLEGRQQ